MTNNEIVWLILILPFVAFLINGVTVKDKKVYPRTKKITEIGIDHNLSGSPLIIGQKAIIANTTLKSIPKLLLELIFSISTLIYYCLKIFKFI